MMTVGVLRRGIPRFEKKLSEMFEGTDSKCLTTNQFPQTFLTNLLKLRIYLYKIPTVITET